MNEKYGGILSSAPKLKRACMSAGEKCGGTLESIAAYAAAPAAFLFACHIISQAEKAGIKRLYFLSRDGYLPMKAAEKICAASHPDIKISYLYVSRFALRMAAYHLHDGSAYEKLFLPSYRMTAGSLLKRAAFSDDERRAVYRHIGFDPNRENDELDRNAFDKLCTQLRTSEVFNDILDKRSLAAYEDTVGYFRQEGMGEYSHIGIADLGWTGSMQAAMKSIFRSCGFDTAVTGYYMGFLSEPPSDSGSEYSAWLFGADDALKKGRFAHNIAECLFTAPHGMTVGYELSEGRYSPVLCPCENDTELIGRLAEISQEVFSAADHTEFDEISSGKMAYRLLTALMSDPSPEEAEAFGRYCFCDDVSEAYHLPVVERVGRSDFSAELLFGRLRAGRSGGRRRLYWYFGSLAVSDVKHKKYYRNMYIFTEAAASAAKGAVKWLRRFFR